MSHRLPTIYLLKPLQPEVFFIYIMRKWYTKCGVLKHNRLNTEPAKDFTPQFNQFVPSSTSWSNGRRHGGHPASTPRNDGRHPPLGATRLDMFFFWGGLRPCIYMRMAVYRVRVPITAGITALCLRQRPTPKPKAKARIETEPIPHSGILLQKPDTPCM